MDQPGDAFYISYPVMIASVIGVSVNLILIIFLVVGQILYRSYGPLRGPGIPKNWARPLVLSAAIYANVLCQVLTCTLAFPQFVDNVKPFSNDEVNFIVKLFLASKLASNWYLVALNIHILLSIYKRSILRRKTQLVLWIITCIFVAIFSACFTCFMFDGEDMHEIHVTCHVISENDTFMIVYKYAPLSCTCLVMLCSLSSLGRYVRFFHPLCNQSNSYDRFEGDKWILDQGKTMLLFQIITVIGFIFEGLVDCLVFFWLFTLATILLKDVRELMLTFICHTGRSCSLLVKDDKKSLDEEMADLKCQDLSRRRLKEKIKYLCEVSANNDDACQIETSGDNDDIASETEVAKKPKDYLQTDEKQLVHAGEVREFDSENGTMNKITELPSSVECVNDASGSKVGKMNVKEKHKQNKKENNKNSKTRQKSKIISKKVSQKMKRQKIEKKKENSEDSTSGSADGNESTDSDAGGEELSNSSGGSDMSSIDCTCFNDD